MADVKNHKDNTTGALGALEAQRARDERIRKLLIAAELPHSDEDIHLFRVLTKRAREEHRQQCARAAAAEVCVAARFRRESLERAARAAAVALESGEAPTPWSLKAG